MVASDVPKTGILVFGKKVFPILGLSRKSLQKCACPFLDDSYFEKIMVVVWQRFCKSGSEARVFFLSKMTDSKHAMTCMICARMCVCSLFVCFTAIAFFSLAHTTMSAFFAGFGFGFGFRTSC